MSSGHNNMWKATFQFGMLHQIKLNNCRLVYDIKLGSGIIDHSQTPHFKHLYPFPILPGLTHPHLLLLLIVSQATVTI